MVFDRTRVVLSVCPPEMELGAVFSKVERKDARCDFILLNGVLEKGCVIESGNGRESHAKGARRDE